MDHPGRSKKVGGEGAKTSWAESSYERMEERPEDFSGLSQFGLQEG
jgi:hypothetical protein